MENNISIHFVGASNRIESVIFLVKTFLSLKTGEVLILEIDILSFFPQHLTHLYKACCQYAHLNLESGSSSIGPIYELLRF